jgi:ankyrin repeat protein
MLLTAGADVNATEGIQGGTPLHSASTKEVAGLLIAQGADVNIKNTFF